MFRFYLADKGVGAKGFKAIYTEVKVNIKHIMNGRGKGASAPLPPALESEKIAIFPLYSINPSLQYFFFLRTWNK